MIEHIARRPLQERSLNRFRVILEAAEELLRTSNIEDISFYDIARQARIPPASVNYLFPTMASLRIELSRRYNEISSAAVIDTQRTLAKMRNPRWQDWIEIMGRQARDHFNANRHVCEVLLGPHLHRESRRASVAANDRIAQSLRESFQHVFIVPDIPGLVHYFSLMFEISDVLWSRAYLANGRLDGRSVEESISMQIAYLRSFLPETLQLVRRGKLSDISQPLDRRAKLSAITSRDRATSERWTKT